MIKVDSALVMSVALILMFRKDCYDVPKETLANDCKRMATVCSWRKGL
jgi:hypothetical protein